MQITVEKADQKVSLLKLIFLNEIIYKRMIWRYEKHGYNRIIIIRHKLIGGKFKKFTILIDIDNLSR